MPTTPVPTGVPDLDDLMGGFRIGDNVILQVDVATPPQAFVRAFLGEALRRKGERVHVVAFDHSPATVLESLAGLPLEGLTLLDCFTHGKGRSESVFRRFYEAERPDGPRVVPVAAPGKPAYFHEVFDEVTTGGRGTYILVDSLTGMTQLWRDEDLVREFYTHTCPRLFDARAIAMWTLHSRVHSDPFRASIGHIAQVVLTLTRQEEDGFLRVERAVGRSRPGMHRARRYEERGDEVVLEPARATRRRG